MYVYRTEQLLEDLSVKSKYFSPAVSMLFSPHLENMISFRLTTLSHTVVMLIYLAVEHTGW